MLRIWKALGSASTQVPLGQLFLWLLPRERKRRKRKFKKLVKLGLCSLPASGVLQPQLHYGHGFQQVKQGTEGKQLLSTLGTQAHLIKGNPVMKSEPFSRSFPVFPPPLQSAPPAAQLCGSPLISEILTDEAWEIELSNKGVAASIRS